MKSRSLLLLSTIGIGLLTGCSASTEYLDKLQSEIQENVVQQGGSSLKSVICSQPQEKKSFQCVGVLDSGSGFDIEVQQKEDESFDWKVPSVKGLLNMGQLQTAIQDGLKKELKGEITIDCGSAQAYRATKPGESFECQVKVNTPHPSDSKPSDQESAQKELKKEEATTQTQANAKSPSPSSKNQPEKIIVTMLPTGDVSWQRLLPAKDEGSKKSDSAKGNATPNGTNLEANKQSQSTGDKSADKAKPAEATQPTDPTPSSQPAPDAAKSAEDFLNQAGATDDF